MYIRKQVTINEILSSYESSRERFRKLPKDEQKKQAIQRLITMGVLNNDGTPKKVICTID